MAESVTTLTDRWIGATGADGSDTRVRARYQREAGLLPTQPRGRHNSPTIEIIHTAVHLCGSLVAGPQLNVVENIKKLFALPQRRETETEEEPHIPHWMTFGQALLLFIDLATTPKGRAILSGSLKFINVTQGGGYGAVVYSDGTPNVQFYGEELPYTQYRAKFATIISAPPEVFFELGDIVMRSRREAAEMHVSIEWQTAWCALGFDPPDAMFPQQPLIPLSTSGRASGGARLETKNAGLPGRRAGVHA
jgi:hypothetical protein